MSNPPEPSAIPPATARSGQPVSVAGAWVPEAHLEGPGCAAEPRRHALASALPAPPCPGCGAPVRWRLVVPAEAEPAEGTR